MPRSLGPYRLSYHLATGGFGEVYRAVDTRDGRIKDIADRVLWLEDGQFKDVVETATDPVCGMAVERARAVAGERDGETYHFCARGCREEFLGPTSRAG